MLPGRLLKLDAGLVNRPLKRFFIWGVESWLRFIVHSEILTEFEPTGDAACPGFGRVSEHRSDRNNTPSKAIWDDLPRSIGPAGRLLTPTHPTG